LWKIFLKKNLNKTLKLTSFYEKKIVLNHFEC